MGNRKFAPKKNLQTNVPRTEYVEPHGTFVWTCNDRGQNYSKYTTNFKRVKNYKKIIPKKSDETLPVKGYDSVNLTSGLNGKVKTFVKARADLGYRSITEFVAEAFRKRTEEIKKSTT